jgi:hypothetical protein
VLSLGPLHFSLDSIAHHVTLDFGYTADTDNMVAVKASVMVLPTFMSTVTGMMLKLPHCLVICVKVIYRLAFAGTAAVPP